MVPSGGQPGGWVLTTRVPGGGWCGRRSQASSPTGRNTYTRWPGGEDIAASRSWWGITLGVVRRADLRPPPSVGERAGRGAVYSYALRWALVGSDRPAWP